MNNPQPTASNVNAMPSQEFINKFITPTIADYKQKSEGAKKKWQRLHLSQYFFVLMAPIVGSVLPMLGWGSEQAIHGLTVAAGFIAAYLTYVITSGNYQLNFVQYEATAAALQAQYALFSAGAKPYDTVDAAKVFAMNFEKIVSDEVQRWAQEMLGSVSAVSDEGHPNA